MHCRKGDDAAWTDVPGLPLKKVGENLFELHLDCSNLEFVFNNGNSEWEAAHDGNYKITTPGCYEVAHRQVATRRVAEACSKKPEQLKPPTTASLSAPHENARALKQDLPLLKGGSGITVECFKPWSQVFMHCRKGDASEWTELPGLQLQQVGEGRFALELGYPKLEFVLNNGAGEWESSSNGNFMIDAPGSYIVKDGEVRQSSCQTEALEKKCDGETSETTDEGCASLLEGGASSVYLPRASASDLETGISLTYKANWQEAFVHCRRGDDVEWTQAPGLPLTKTGDGLFSLRLDTQSLEFVFTNGSGEWDSPAHGNYFIESPGSFSVCNGHVSPTH
jgi:hypothetical protein